MNQIPVRKDSFVQSSNGQNLRVWLCLGKYRADELFRQQVEKHDPFVNHFGEITAVKAWEGYP